MRVRASLRRRHKRLYTSSQLSPQLRSLSVTQSARVPRIVDVQSRLAVLWGIENPINGPLGLMIDEGEEFLHCRAVTPAGRNIVPRKHVPFRRPGVGYWSLRKLQCLRSRDILRVEREPVPSRHRSHKRPRFRQNPKRKPTCRCVDSKDFYCPNCAPWKGVLATLCTKTRKAAVVPPGERKTTGKGKRRGDAIPPPPPASSSSWSAAPQKPKSDCKEQPPCSGVSGAMRAWRKKQGHDCPLY